MILEQWFSTPIWYGDFNKINEQEYNYAINYCNYLRTNSTGRVVSNIGGWQSNNLYLNDIIDTPLQIFFEQIRPVVKEILLSIGVTHELKVNNIWININNSNDKNNTHDHPSSSISGVFYLTNNNSNIVFHRNKDIGNFHLDWLGSNRNTDLSYEIVKYTPVQGQYLIFPSWLVHSVEPNMSTEKRISIAFNVSFI